MIDNRRIAKNTLYMYVRMGLSMLISLYTSRVVLNALGVSDFGVNNVVGSLVVMYWMFSGPLETATQRFLNFELGRNNPERLNRVFCISLQCYVFLAVVLFVILEVAGLWFLNTHLQIPTERMTAARWVFHMGVISTVISLLGTPFNALIIAHERLSFYAYIGILEAVLKLLNAMSLLCLAGDKLTIYATNGMLIALIIFVPIVVFCRRKFRDIHIRRTRDKALLREILSFTGWNMFGSAASMTSSQGVNIVINLFFGVVVNAAMGVANQVNSAVQKFAWNFQTAFRPQLVKLYAAGQISDLHKLIFRTSKFSYLLLFALGCPLMFNMDYVLRLWLVNPPAQASTFAILMIINAIISGLSAPLWNTAQATGDIRNYQIVLSAIILMNIVLTYIFLSLGYPALIALVISIALNIVQLAVRLWFMKRMIGLSYRQFIVNVIVPVTLVTAAATLLTKLISTNVDSFGKLALTVTIFAVCYLPITYLIGLHSRERSALNQLILSKLKC